MAKENTGEWKLLKVWECKKCKLLIRDGREVFDHACTEEEKEDVLLRLKNIIKAKDLALEERDKFVDGQRSKIVSLEIFVKELEDVIADFNSGIQAKDKTIDEQKLAIDEQKFAIEEQKITIEEQKKTIISQNITIEDQKKNQNKVIEKIVYLEANASKTNSNNAVESISVDILQRDNRIKDSKDSGYREEIDIEIFERGKGREKIIIKNGKVIKKPDDIIIIGENTSEGFIIKGIYRN